MVQANPERPGQRRQHHHDDGGGHQPGAQPVKRLIPAVITIQVPVIVKATPNQRIEHFPTTGVSFQPITKTILFYVFVHWWEHIQPPADYQRWFLKWILHFWQGVTDPKRNATATHRDRPVHTARPRVRGGRQVFGRSTALAGRLCFNSACAFFRHFGQMPWVKSAPVVLWK